ncbi:unnamed protein product, partial [Medioppia subpectinata]
MKTIQNVKIIKQMMKSMSDANDGNDHSIDEFLTQILIADLMFGKKLVGLKDVPQVRHIVSFHDKFTHILKNFKGSRGSDRKAGVRYIRVNLIKTNIKKVINKLVKNGFKQIDYNKCDITFDEFKELA